MEKSLFLAVVCIGFDLLDTVSSFPIDISSVGAGDPHPIWLSGYILTAIGFLFMIVAVIFGCVCCRNGKGFKEFSNSSGNLAASQPEGFVNPTLNSELTIFPPLGANSNQICRFEPLPDIKPPAPNLRPAAFSYSEREISSQDWFFEPCNNFPRNQLKYVQEYGRGWFGRVVEGEAQNITPHEKVTKVMVKILHEDATPTDQMYFLHEVKFYRDLKHPNILRLLARCLETEPFLIILECYPNGDLKSFLSQNLASAQALAEQGVTLQMCSNITSGLQYMHENKFIHTDLAARNCLVGPDLTVKIGDYGNSIEIFKSDYYCAGSVALPVRWCAPETLKCTDITIETREVTPPANIWSLAVVFWEISEFCKLPYAELNDDQVIVRVLGEKNYFLEKPSMFCLHKDELYHLMKLCWNPPLQRPTASQIRVILDNLISSGKVTQKEVQIDSKRLSQDFEQRWQNLKPNSIPKKDNATETDYSANCNIISSKLRNAKVVDSSLIDSPLGIFMAHKGSGQESPRLCLTSDKVKPSKVDKELECLEKVDEGADENSVNEGEEAPNVGVANDLNNKQPVKVEFEYSTEVKQPHILNPNQKFHGVDPDVDSWLKGVEINNEEDESFVRKISEAIRDLDATLALEKTSSSEETSGKSSRQNSPGKDAKEGNEISVDFKLGSDTSSFLNFTQKSFEISSLQNTEQPQSLNFTDPFINETKNDLDESFGPSSLIMPLIDEARNNFMMKGNALDESLKENDSLVCAQSRNSSDTDDEIWRKRIERGEISEKVKEKSKSIANLMILTHIDASDDSDVDLDKPFEKGINRNSFLRRSGSFAKSSLSSNNFGSENDLTYAVLEDEFKESLKKLSNDHKEHGRFDSLGVILPSSARREGVWENLFKSSGEEGNATQTDVNRSTEEGEKSPVEKEIEQNTPSSNNFLCDIASEKIKDNTGKEEKSENEISSESEPAGNVTKLGSINAEKDILVESYSKCDSSTCNNINSSCNSSEMNSSQLRSNVEGSDTKNGSLLQEESESCCKLPENNRREGECQMERTKNGDFLGNEVLCKENEDQRNKSDKASCDISSLKTNETISVPNDTLGKGSMMKSEKPRNPTIIPQIKMTEAEEVEVETSEEVFEPVVTKFKPFKFVLKESSFVPQITITEDPEEELDDVEEEKFEFEKQNVKPFKFVLKDESIAEVLSGHTDLEKIESQTFSKKCAEEIAKPVSDEDTTVIIGACEDFTLDYFKGLKTTSEGINLKSEHGTEKNENIQKIMEDLQDKEAHLDVWDKHLETAFTQQLKDINFDDISFRSLGSDPSEVNNQAKQGVLREEEDDPVFPKCPANMITDFIESEKMHTEKVEEPIHINRLTNLTVMPSEEEYENFKLRTPDDERSSDSGFRDKGSLSESVEDGCEGKYNLEDIEAELEEAYVKGVFGNCEVDKDKDSNKSLKNCNNFEYEESKFYEDENKNEEDFSDIDGEIEFWHNKDDSDYYPEISEFNPTCSQGWYLHPPDDNAMNFNRTVNEDIVNALRNELRENLPVQTRSFDEFNDFYETEVNDPKRELNIHYFSDFALPLSPIVEEHDNTMSDIKERNIKNSLLNGNRFNKPKKSMVNLMESVKGIDTNTFMQYLDYMIENEGKDLDELDETGEENDKSKEELMLVPDTDESRGLQDKNFEDDIKKALGVDSNSGSDSLTSDTEPSGALLLEDLESGSTKKVAQGAKAKDDILVVNIDTNEATLLESSKPKSYVAFVDAPERKDDLSDIVTDNSENDGLVFTPEMLSPCGERSLSEISRSSNGTRTGDALSDITLSSPDLVPDCFSTSVQEIVPNNEASEIIKELKDSGIIDRADSITPDNSISANLQSFPIISAFEDDPSKEDEDVDSSNLNSKEASVLKNNQKPTIVEPEPERNDQHEMSTSFMGCDDDEEEETSSNLDEFERVAQKREQSEDQKSDKDLGAEDSDTADWESDTSGGEEEMSSSSGEFIWKLREKSQSDQSTAEMVTNDSIPLSANKEKSCNGNDAGEEDDEDDDNESSTGSSASITDFVPSAWNSQATPSRSALRSPDKKSDQQQKKNVWFKKQKYHCVYEYPREPSDNEDSDTGSPYKQFSYEKSTPEAPSKHFNFGVNTVELPNKHFPYGISNVIDYSSFTDWDLAEKDELDLSLTDTDSENGFRKSDLKESDFNFYNSSPFDYDFSTGGLPENESEFFVSSSSRPFQGGLSSQFFPGNNQLPLFNDTKPEVETPASDVLTSRDFTTPDSGLEDSTNVTPQDKKIDISQESTLLQVDNSNESKTGILNILDNLKFNFPTEAKDGEGKHLETFGEEGKPGTNGFCTSASNSPSSPLSPSGLGELRHARDKLKLDLPHNHNAELGAVINKKNQQNSLKL